MDYVLKPLKLMEIERTDLFSRIPFSIESKDMQLSYHIKKIFEEMPNLFHKSDGIIFTSSEDVYTLGTDENIIKWKPAEENTVDFKLFVKNNPLDFDLHLWYGADDHRFHSHLCVTDNETIKLLSLSQGRIIECSWSNDHPGNWKFVRFRSDKNTANHVDVYKKIMLSIRDSVTSEELLAEVSNIKRQWKNREASQINKSS
ncbi:Dcp1p-Dcp2p decapping enzyme complex alpha subunit [Coelomomyces lativittatus]|nr:Dcp1p-Dcp2p decapping enzyme complex alpha subunit [Coelomomyces lativittatus]KAJ1513170.1 Dcp1p-Dcp2p decapping enzyme complex alpha subunit [Coelomomyces lativittatus]